MIHSERGLAFAAVDVSIGRPALVVLIE